MRKPSPVEPLRQVLEYHRLSKHRPQGYAPGPGYLDWANQPDPFRRFPGAVQLDLALAADRLTTRWGELTGPDRVAPAPLARESIGALLELCLGLAAWKSFGGNRWALRCNPSSGNLHPTEGYLLVPDLNGLEAGVYHYQSHDHRLERRLAATDPAWSASLGGNLLLGLSSIHWREAWKYGARAFRYCQLDTGHALAAARYAAAALGWTARLLTAPGDAEIATLLGLGRSADFAEAEAEEPELLLEIGPGGSRLGTLLALAGGGGWQGTANRLSAAHRDWPQIARVSGACRKPPGPSFTRPTAPDLPPLRRAGEDLKAATLFRRRRSAQAFDHRGGLTRQGFFAILDSLLPRPGTAPWDALPWEPRLHPMLFVHRVEGVTPGLYALPRSAASLERLPAAMRPEWLWEKVPGCPGHIPLRLLLPLRLEDAARQLACLQDIAGDSAFALGMLADFRTLRELGAHWYRYLYWEAGVLGQCLYLDAEALGLRGTGIGCYFDDPFHELLGLEAEDWQVLYMFTLGEPLEDHRLESYPPYAHLQPRG
jgi:SagB-type dehydrogenase family enzyme